MGRLDRSEPYNWIECTSHPIPVRILGPNDEQYPILSRVLSDVRLAADRRSDGTNIISSFVWALNQALRSCEDPAALFEKGVAEFRKAQDAFIKSVGVQTSPCSRSKGARWISPPAGHRNRIAAALLAIEKVAAGLAELIFDGVDPSRTPEWLAAGSIKHSSKTYNDKWVSETGRRYRVPGSDPSQAPRSNDPRIFERWQTAASDLDLNEDVQWIGRICRHTGSRSMSTRALTLFDYLVARPFPDVIMAPTKGSKGERTLRLLLSTELDTELMARTKKKYPAHVGAWERGDKSVYSKLRNTPLFSINGRDPVAYWFYNREFMRAARKADLCFMDYVGGEPLVTYVTPQQLRHEHVFEALLWIQTLPEAEQASAREDLIQRMRWKGGEAMLRWYSHFFAMQKALSSARRMDTLPSAVGSPAHTINADDDDVLALLAEM